MLTLIAIAVSASLNMFISAIIDDILQEVFRTGDDAVYTGNLVANAYLVYMGLMKASFDEILTDIFLLVVF